MVNPEKITGKEFRKLVQEDLGGEYNRTSTRIISNRYGGFFRPLTKKEERSERKKLKYPQS